MAKGSKDKAPVQRVARWDEVASGVSVVDVRRPDLRELYVTASPSGGPDAAERGRQVFGEIASILGRTGASGVQERIFVELSQADVVLAERQRALGLAGDQEAWPVTVIEGAPPGRGGLAGVQLYAVSGPQCRPLRHDGQVCGVAFEHADVEHLYLNSRRGQAGAMSRPEDAGCALTQAADCLSAAGSTYPDVVRTWIYLADLLDWYDEFNVVRNGLYTEWGLMGEGATTQVPASTGIEGSPPDGNACSMDLLALTGPGRANLTITPLHNPLQNEAYSYGSAFARGLVVGFDGAETAYISGTASIDENGDSIHIGDLDKQVLRTIENIAALIGTRGFTLDDVAVATLFVKHGQDAVRVRELLSEHGGAMKHGVLVAADVCRHDLLFEIDGLAVRAVE